MKTKEQLRGLKDLALDAVENGSIAFERVHVATAKKTFDVLEQIPTIAAPVRGLHAMHDTALQGAYNIVRMVNQVVGDTLEAALGEPPAEPAKPPVATRPRAAAPEIARSRSAS